MIGLWVKLLSIPYRYLYPSAMFFVCIGVYAANNDMFQVGETLFIGVIGYILLRLDFHPAPILLGFVLGPRFEENFRRSLLISRGDLMTFIERPISAFFLLICVVLIVAQIYVWLRKPKIIAEERRSRPRCRRRRIRNWRVDADNGRLTAVPEWSIRLVKLGSASKAHRHRRATRGEL